jgi:hypothetical protein
VENRRNRSGVGISKANQNLELLIVPSDEEFTTLSVESINEWSGAMFGAMCREFSFIPILSILTGINS